MPTRSAAAAGRLAHVLGAVTAAPAAAVAGAHQGGRATATAPARLNDAAMQAFVRDGYCMLRPELPADYNAGICAKVESLHEAGRDMVPRSKASKPPTPRREPRAAQLTASPS